MSVARKSAERFVGFALTAVLLGIGMGTGIGCGPTITEPSNQGTILEKIGENEAEELKSDAPEAYEKAVQYAVLADEMAAKGDKDAERRYADLSRYHLQLAKLQTEKRRLEIAIEKTETEKQRIQEALRNTQRALELLAAESERQRIRAHLTEVVKETRLRAAAEEAERERLYAGKDKRAIRQARKQVAEEMISRAKVWLDVLQFFAPNDTERQAYLLPVEEPIEAAEALGETVDLAMVQEILERAGVAGQELLADAWTKEDNTDRHTASKEILSQLRGSDIDASDDEFGIVVPLPVEPTKTDTSDLLMRIRDALNPIPSYRIVVLASVKARKASNEQSSQLAADTGRRLVAIGIPEASVHHRGVGARVPLAALKGDDARLALIIIPAPNPTYPK